MRNENLGSWVLKVNHLMLDKMISSVEINTFLFRYSYRTVQYAVQIKAIHKISMSVIHCKVLGSVIIHRVYKLNMIIQQARKLAIFLCLQQMNSSKYTHNSKEEKN